MTGRHDELSNMLRAGCSPYEDPADRIDRLRELVRGRGTPIHRAWLEVDRILLVAGGVLEAMALPAFDRAMSNLRVAVQADTADVGAPTLTMPRDEAAQQLGISVARLENWICELHRDRKDPVWVLRDGPGGWLISRQLFIAWLNRETPKPRGRPKKKKRTV